MVWIAATGLVCQLMTLGGGGHDGPPPAAAPGPDGASKAAAPAGDGDHDATAPKPRAPRHDLHHLIIDLHSGKYFGPFGKIVSAVMGAMLLFFALSGMWMYLDMFRRRKTIGRSGIFWS